MTLRSVDFVNSIKYLLDLRAGDAEPELITSHDGNISYGVHEFTSDSSKLVYSTNEHGEFDQAWTYDLETGEKAPLVSADWDVMFVFYSDSGRYRVSATNDDARTRVQILDTQSGEDLELPGLPPGDLAQVRSRLVDERRNRRPLSAKDISLEEPPRRHGGRSGDPLRLVHPDAAGVGRNGG